jgi:predicted nucleotidyltransferase
MVSKIRKETDMEELKKRLLPILKRHQVYKAGIFGSVATGTARKTSDLDLLIDFKGEKDLFDLVALKLDLETEINRHVDVLTYASLNPYRLYPAYPRKHLLD